ncbi:MAG: PD-(D/E)XK nuclease family protein [Armatimonadetes bacterium]|nr:PD-(D/E)XK nuclease family protein [Armatimonadota bacterium]
MGKMFGFSWSFTREELFHTCERAFFYEYAAKDEPYHAEAFRLRNLTTPVMMAGTIVDSVIGMSLKALKNGGEVQTDLASKGARIYEKWWKDSTSFGPTYQKGDPIPDKATVLYHHYFSKDDDEAEKQSGAQRVQNCLYNFENSSLWETIQEKAIHPWSEIRVHGDGLFPKSFVTDSGLELWAAYDFYIQEEPSLHILDWKTGARKPNSETKAAKQLSIYTLYGNKALGIDLPQVTVQAIWLQESPEWCPQQIDEKSILAVETETHRQSESVFSRLKQDTFWPKGNKWIYIANEADFPPSPHPNKCKRCKFQTICSEGIKFHEQELEEQNELDEHDPFEEL